MDPEFSKLNYENFLKQFWISVNFSHFFGRQPPKNKRLLKKRYFKASDSLFFIDFLKEEKNYLDNLIEFVESKDEKSEIDIEIQKLEADLAVQAKENTRNISKYKEENCFNIFENSHVF